MANNVAANRKNGSTKKTIKAPTGSFELATLREHNGTFQPQRVKQHQSTLSNEIEQKITRLFTLGISDTSISQEIEDLYVSSARWKTFTPLSGWKTFTIKSEKIIIT